MKAILEFNLPEDRMEHTRAVKSTDAFLALWDVAQEIFRPARKHGYVFSTSVSAERLNELLACNDDGTEMYPGVAEAIHLLEEKFYEIVNERGVNPNDLLE